MNIQENLRSRNLSRPKIVKMWKRYNLFGLAVTILLILTFFIGQASANTPTKKPTLTVSKDTRLFEIQSRTKSAVVTTTTTTTVAPVIKSVIKTHEKSPAPPTAPIAIEGTHEEWMTQAGISQAEWQYVDYIISHESGWRPHAVSPNNCIGLGQNCPWNGKYFLPLACPNWQSDPVCQLRRWSEYAGKYGGWAGAYRYRVNNGNW